MVGAYRFPRTHSIRSIVAIRQLFLQLIGPISLQFSLLVCRLEHIAIVAHRDVKMRRFQIGHLIGNLSFAHGLRSRRFTPEVLRFCLFNAGSATCASYGVSVLPACHTDDFLDVGRLLSDVCVVLLYVLSLVWRYGVILATSLKLPRAIEAQVEACCAHLIHLCLSRVL